MASRKCKNKNLYVVVSVSQISLRYLGLIQVSFENYCKVVLIFVFINYGNGVYVHDIRRCLGLYLKASPRAASLYTVLYFTAASRDCCLHKSAWNHCCRSCVIHFISAGTKRTSGPQRGLCVCVLGTRVSCAKLLNGSGCSLGRTRLCEPKHRWGQQYGDR